MKTSMELEMEAEQQHYNSDYINNYHENENENENGTGSGTEYEFGLQSLENNTQTLLICLGIIYTLVGLAGCFGNGLVVYVFTRPQQAKKEDGINSLILSLSVSDLMVSFVQFISVYSAFTQTGPVGTIGCSLYGALTSLGAVISILTTFCMVLMQFYTIYGFSAAVCLANVLTCKCVWALSFVLICPSFLGWSEFALEGIGISCSLNWKAREFIYNYFYILLVLAALVVSLIFLTVTYAGIRKLGRGLGNQHPETRLVTAAGTDTSTSTAINMANDACQEQDSLSQMLTVIRQPTKEQHQLLQMVLIMLSCLSISWLPYLVINMVQQFSSVPTADGEPWPVSQLAITGTSIFAKLPVLCNPLIYILFHPEFRGLLVLSLQNAHTGSSAYKHSMVPSIAENGCDFRRPSSAVGLRANSIPGSRITPSNSICASHASFNSHHSRYNRHGSTSQDRSRSGSGTSEMARSSITSGGRRPTISSSNTFRQVRTNSSCSSSSAAAITLPPSFHHHYHYNQLAARMAVEDSSSPSQWREDWKNYSRRTSQEVPPSKFGWAIQRRPSNCCSSSGTSSTIFPPSRRHSKVTPKSSFQSVNGMTRVNYSEPDLPRFNDRIIKNAGLIPFREYKRRKTQFWRKSLFLSENCLESLCSASKLHERSLPVYDPHAGSRSKTPSPSPTYSQQSESFTFDKRRPSTFVNGAHNFVKNVLSVPAMTSSSPGRLSLTGNGKLLSSHQGGKHNRSKSMRAPKTGNSHKFLELPARFKRHSDGGVYTHRSASPSPSPTSNFNNRKQSQPAMVNGIANKSRSNSKDNGQRKESSIIMVTSPCGDTASVKLESFEMNDTDNRIRKFSEVSSQYQNSRNNSSKKLSFELGSKRDEWKYVLVHQKECCDCSASGCHQDHCPADLP